MNMPSFVIPSAGTGSPDSVERRRKMAEAMMAQGVDTSPVGHWSQGAARMVQALVGGLSMRRAENQETQGRQSAKEAMLKALAGDNSAIADAMSNPWNDQYQNAMLLDKYKQNNPPPRDPLDIENDQLTNAKLKAEIEKMNRPEKPDLMNVGKGAAIFDPTSGEWITPPAGAVGGGQAIEDPMKISKDFQAQPGMERIAQIAPTIQSMYRSLEDPSAMADLDFVYGLAKILDPTSVVRESEGKMVIDSQGIGPSLLGQLNKLVNGDQAMLPETRKKLFGVAIRRAEELKKQADQEREFYSNMATENQFNPDTYLQKVPQLPEMQAPPMGGAGGAPDLKKKYGLE